MNKQATLKELSDLTNARFHGNSDHCVDNVCNLERAKQTDISFLANPKYKEAMRKSNAGIVCIGCNEEIVEGKNFLISENPSETFQKIINFFSAERRNMYRSDGIHPASIIDPSAQIGINVSIGAGVVIESNVIIEKNTRIYPNVVICTNSKIGSNCVVYPNVTIREESVIGSNVILQPGAVIGSCGFGYISDKKSGKHTKLEQLGNVVIENNVEIGANTTIDRARFQSTIIKSGTKIDNLVQIGHNVHIGKDNLIISQTGIAGSSKTGSNVVFGGQVGVVGHVNIVDNVMVASRGAISKSVLKSGLYGGAPISPIREYNKREVLIRKISVIFEDLVELKKQVKKILEKMV